MFWGLLGSRHVQASLENIVFCFFFAFFVFLVSLDFWFLRINPDNANQIWFILPPRHSCEVITKKSIYAKHAQYSLGMCNFPFQVWSLWGCKIMFLEKETFPSNKWCSCPSRAQLEFCDRSVTYLHRNGVIERIVTYFQIMVYLVTFKRCSWFNFCE